jgi:glycosyltransferase involved in cell wall biosynthesis
VKITILTQYYPPETGAPQNRLSDLARRLSDAGHQITVLTAKPNYPAGKIHTDFAGGLWKIRNQNGVRAIHCLLFACRSKRTFLRLANYFSFVLSSAAIGTFLLHRHDFLIVESPPIFLGLTAWYLSRLKRAKMVFNVSDLYPQTAIELGYLRRGIAARLLFALEAWCYRSSVLVTGQTRGIVDDIKRRFPSQRVLLLTNGVDVTDFTSFEAMKPPGDVFVIGYAGVLGHAQGLPAVLDAAKRLLAMKVSVRLELFGDGPLREDLQERARALELSNLQFFGHRSRTEVIQRMKEWDAGIVPLINAPLMSGALPSKMFELMAAALPVVLTVPRGEASDLIESARAGVWAEAENAKSIAEAIQRLAADRDAARRMGEQGRRFVLEHFDRSRIAQEFMIALESMVTSCG